MRAKNLPSDLEPKLMFIFLQGRESVRKRERERERERERKRERERNVITLESLVALEKEVGNSLKTFNLIFFQ